MDQFAGYKMLIEDAVRTSSINQSTDGNVRGVDVAMNIYGKPYNTAATLYSLLRHSGKWIDKIYFITEKRQPHKSDFGFIADALGSRLVRYTPPLWLWVRPFRNKVYLRFKPFRMSVRYQYAWEHTDKNYLFISHNDVLYTGDIIGAMLQKAGDNIGVGQVGQCWNCSANFAGLCSPETYMGYRPTYEELKKLLKEFPGSRQKDYGKLPVKNRPWPLPECRLNEWAALVNMKQAREVTMPKGPAVPFGAFYDLDINTRWFSDVTNMGYTVSHFDLRGYADHAWAGRVRSGHMALLDNNEYEHAEHVALSYLQAELQKITNT